MFNKVILTIKRYQRRAFVFVALVMLLAGIVFPAPQKAAALEPHETQGNFGSANFVFPDSPDYLSSEIEITPQANAAPDGYFFAQQVGFQNCINTCGAYVGLQTNGSEFPGKIAVFSMFEGIQAIGPQYTAYFDHEGVGYTARIKYDWQINRTYRVRTYKHSTVSDGDWWAASITDTTTGVESYIGRLKLPLGRGNLNEQSIAFHERYSEPTATCTGMAYSKVQFTNARLNGTVAPTQTVPFEKTDSSCGSLYETAVIPDGIRTVVGGQMEYPAGVLNIAVNGAPPSAGTAAFFSSSTRPIGDCGTQQIAPITCISRVRNSIPLPVGNADHKSVIYPAIEETPLGYKFDSWSGACVGGTQPFGGCIVYVPIGQTQTVTANFVPDPRAVLRIEVNGLTPGINTGFFSNGGAVGTCSSNFGAPPKTCFGTSPTASIGNANGTTIIYPNPNLTPVGYKFVSWSGACIGGTLPFGGCRVHVQPGQAQVVTANYEVKNP